MGAFVDPLSVHRTRALLQANPPADSWQTRSKERIRAVLGSSVPSTEAASLLAEAERNAVDLERSLVTAAKQSVDPMSGTEECLLARQRHERLQHDREMLAETINRLKQRIVQLQEAEANATAEVEYKKAQAERDKLATRLADRYVALQADLIEMLEAIDASDARIAKCNRDLGGRPWLASAEAIARGCDAMFRTLSSEQHPAPARALRLRELKLIDFDPHNQRFAWPLPPQNTAVSALIRG